MRVLLLTLWKPRKGGVVTHVENLIKNSRNEFIIQSYPQFIDLPLFRAFSFVLVGFFMRLTTKYDIIHAHYALPQGFLGVLLKKVRKKPLILTLHGSDLTLLAKSQITRPIVKLVLRSSDRVLVVSEFLKRETVKLGIGEEKIRVVYMGSAPRDTKKEEFGLDGRIVTFIGGLVKQKGVDILLEAFKEVPDAKLVIVGDGKERSNLERLASDIEDVHFLGYREDLISVLEKSRVLVLPSRQEGFGLILLEAMSAGVPVVATRVGGIVEIVEDRYNGILVEPENPEQLAEGINRVLEDRELRKNLIENGRKTVERFSRESVSNVVDEIYEEFS